MFLAIPVLPVLLTLATLLSFCVNIIPPFSKVISFLVNPTFLTLLVLKTIIFDLAIPFLRKLPLRQILEVFLLDILKIFSLFRILVFTMPYYSELISASSLGKTETTLATIFSSIIFFNIVPSVFADVITISLAFSKAREQKYKTWRFFISFPICSYGICVSLILINTLAFLILQLLSNFGIGGEIANMSVHDFLVDLAH